MLSVRIRFSQGSKFVLTSAILVADIWEAPDVAQINGEPRHRQQEVQFVSPRLPCRHVSFRAVTGVIPRTLYFINVINVHVTRNVHITEIAVNAARERGLGIGEFVFVVILSVCHKRTPLLVIVTKVGIRGATSGHVTVMHYTHCNNVTTAPVWVGKLM